ncbi:DUF1990 family protein [Thalassiella azotivora]
MPGPRPAEPWLLRATARRVTGTQPAYDGVRGTLTGGCPPGYRWVEYRTDLGAGDRVWRAATEAVMTWRMHRGAGLRVLADGPRAEVGVTVVLGLGVGPLQVPIPCRVVAVVDEPDSAGFAYGTLPGHPVAGEELFVVERDGGRVRLRVVAFSRPATWWARAGAPLTRVVQRVVTGRYLRAVQHAVDAPPAA